MPNIKHKVLRQLLYVAAELLRTGRNNAFEVCVKAYVNISFALSTVSSVSDLKSVQGVGPDGVLKWLKNPRYKFEAVKCRSAAPPQSIPQAYSSVAVACLAVIRQEVEAAQDGDVLLPEVAFKGRIRTMLDADRTRLIPDHLLGQIVSKVLKLISGQAHSYLKRRRRLGSEVYQLTSVGLQALRVAQAWAKQIAGAAAATPRRSGGLSPAAPVNVASQRSWGQDEVYHGLLLLVDNREGPNRTFQALTQPLRTAQISFESHGIPSGLGDYVFIFRHVSEGGKQTDFLLPCAIERKSWVDLGESMLDGRFQRQKDAMKLAASLWSHYSTPLNSADARSALELTYLVEMFNDVHTRTLTPIADRRDLDKWVYPTCGLCGATCAGVGGCVQRGYPRHSVVVSQLRAMKHAQFRATISGSTVASSSSGSSSSSRASAIFRVEECFSGAGKRNFFRKIFTTFERAILECNLWGYEFTAFKAHLLAWRRHFRDCGVIEPPPVQGTRLPSLRMQRIPMLPEGRTKNLSKLVQTPSPVMNPLLDGQDAVSLLRQTASPLRSATVRTGLRPGRADEGDAILNTAFKRTFKPFTARWALMVALHVLLSVPRRQKIAIRDAIDYIDNENNGLKPRSSMREMEKRGMQRHAYSPLAGINELWQNPGVGTDKKDYFALLESSGNRVESSEVSLTTHGAELASILHRQAHYHVNIVPGTGEPACGCGFPPPPLTFGEVSNCNTSPSLRSALERGQPAHNSGQCLRKPWVIDIPARLRKSENSALVPQKGKPREDTQMDHYGRAFLFAPLKVQIRAASGHLLNFFPISQLQAICEACGISVRGFKTKADRISQKILDYRPQSDARLSTSPGGLRSTAALRERRPVREFLDAGSSALGALGIVRTPVQAQKFSGLSSGGSSSEGRANITYEQQVRIREKRTQALLCKYKKTSHNASSSGLSAQLSPELLKQLSNPSGPKRKTPAHPDSPISSRQKPKSCAIYTDGACVNNGKPRAAAGYGVFFGIGDPRNVSKPLCGKLQTNQRAELTAIIEALRIVLKDSDWFRGQAVAIKSDSQYAVKGWDGWVRNWKRNGWKTALGKPVSNKDLWVALDDLKSQLREKRLRVKLEWVRGHDGDPGNEAADELAVAGIQHQGARTPKAAPRAADLPSERQSSRVSDPKFRPSEVKIPNAFASRGTPSVSAAQGQYVPSAHSSNESGSCAARAGSPASSHAPSTPSLSQSTQAEDVVVLLSSDDSEPEESLSVPPVSAAIASTAQVAANEEDFQRTIRCSACTFDNHANAIQCSVCGRVLGLEEKPATASPAHLPVQPLTPTTALFGKSDSEDSDHEPEFTHRIADQARLASKPRKHESEQQTAAKASAPHVCRDKLISPAQPMKRKLGRVASSPQAKRYTLSSSSDSGSSSDDDEFSLSRPPKKVSLDQSIAGGANLPTAASGHFKAMRPASAPAAGATAQVDILDSDLGNTDTSGEFARRQVALSADDAEAEIIVID